MFRFAKALLLVSLLNASLAHAFGGEKGTLGFRLETCETPFGPQLILVPEGTPKTKEKVDCPSFDAFRKTDSARHDIPEHDGTSSDEGNTADSPSAPEAVVRVIFEIAKPYWSLLERMMEEERQNESGY